MHDPSSHWTAFEYNFGELQWRQFTRCLSRLKVCKLGRSAGSLAGPGGFLDQQCTLVGQTCEMADTEELKKQNEKLMEQIKTLSIRLAQGSSGHMSSNELFGF